MRKPHLTLIFDINIQERYEETSGNILLTLRSITQKPLQYFLDNKDFTKVRNIFRQTKNKNKKHFPEKIERKNSYCSG